MAKLAIAKPEVTKRVRARQYVYEATWHIEVDDKEEIVVQLVAAKDFQSAFFKARRWAVENCTGVLVQMVRKENMIV